MHSAGSKKPTRTVCHGLVFCKSSFTSMSFHQVSPPGRSTDKSTSDRSKVDCLARSPVVHDACSTGKQLETTVARPEACRVHIHHPDNLGRGANYSSFRLAASPVSQRHSPCGHSHRNCLSVPGNRCCYSWFVDRSCYTRHGCYGEDIQLSWSTSRPTIQLQANGSLPNPSAA